MQTHEQKDLEGQYYHQRADELVLSDLIDMLLQEVEALATRGVVSSDALHSQLPLHADEVLFKFALNDHQMLCWRARRAILQSYRLSRLPVMLMTLDGENIHSRCLRPDDVLSLLTDTLSTEEQAQLLGLERVREELNLAVAQTALSLQAAEACEKKVQETSSLIALEQLAALRDRPFHPTARARVGWQVEEYTQYGAEFARSYGIDWLAVCQAYLKGGTGVTDEGVAPFVLSPEECHILDQKMEEAGLSPQEYLPLPVHPWQMQHLLPNAFAREWQRGICVPLTHNLGNFVSTSSVRTLVPLSNQAYHLKLPLGIYTLGALRSLPPRYMENGQKGRALLQKLRRRNAFLRERLLYCREDAWWAFTDPERAPFDTRNGHLGCLLRHYPREVTNMQVFPMSALTVTKSDGQAILFPQLLRERGSDPADPAQAQTLFREICDIFLQVALTCAKYGILPEMHGQNVLLVASQGRIMQILLRDHDTIRIYLPWLLDADLPDPGYTVKPNTRNTLILQNPEEFLAPLLTLGVQVNLYAIARMLEKAYGIDEAQCWSIIDDSLRQALASITCSEKIKSKFTQVGLDSPTWPLKQVLLPLLRRTNAGDEGMPSGLGTIANPLHHTRKKEHTWLTLPQRHRNPQ